MPWATLVSSLFEEILSHGSTAVDAWLGHHAVVKRFITRPYWRKATRISWWIMGHAVNDGKNTCHREDVEMMESGRPCRRRGRGCKLYIRTRSKKRSWQVTTDKSHRSMCADSEGRKGDEDGNWVFSLSAPGGGEGRGEVGAGPRSSPPRTTCGRSRFLYRARDLAGTRDFPGPRCGARGAALGRRSRHDVRKGESWGDGKGDQRSPGPWNPTYPT